jgi:uncharacterized protein
MSTRYFLRSTLFLIAVSQTISAAVDCHSPRSRQQRVVCVTPELMILDQQLSAQYDKALAATSGVERTQLEADQHSWEYDSGGCWDRVDCIRKRYSDRIAALQDFIASAAPKQRQTPQPTAPVVPTPTSRRMTPAQMAQAQAIEAARRQAQEPVPDLAAEAAARTAQFRREEMERAQQAAKIRADAEVALDAAQERFDRMNDQKDQALKVLHGFEDLGPLPTVEPSNSHSHRAKGRSSSPEAQTRLADELNAESDKIESQLPVLQKEVIKRQTEAMAYAKQVLARSNVRTPETVELENLIASSGSSPDGASKAYQAAKTLAATIRSLAAAKQKAEKAIASARTELGTAAKYSGDRQVATAVQATTQTVNQLAAKIQSVDPKDETQISKLTETLGGQQNRLKMLTSTASVLSTATAKRVYDGCYAWAKRKGLIASTPVRVFKDDATNDAAALAFNTGEPYCRCIAAEIAKDKEITDAAKLEIADQFETRDRMDNQQLAVVVAVAGGRCQMYLVDQLSGGRLSGRR